MCRNFTASEQKQTLNFAVVFFLEKIVIGISDDLSC